MKAVFKTTGSGGTSGPPRRPIRDHTVTYPAGTTIFQEGELGTEMFIIQEGVVEISKRIRGEAHRLSVLERGDFFGEMSVIDTAPRSADAVATTEVRLLVINGARFDEMIRKTPEIAIRIIRKYSKRLREANAMLERHFGEEFHPEMPQGTAAAEPIGDDTRGGAGSVPAVRLVDVASGTAFPFGSGTEATIGRSDPVTGIRPEIDLTSLDTSRSVSRRHAKLICREGEWYVLEEVGTVNGTFVNDERIATGHPVPIRNGDRLRIGLMLLKVIFD